MGACTSKTKEPCQDNKAPAPLQEMETNLNSGQKQQPQSNQKEIDEPSNRPEKEVPVKQYQDIEAIKADLLGAEFADLCLETNCDLMSQINQRVNMKDRKLIVSLVKAFIICVKDLEQQIYQLDRKYPSEVMNNFQQLLQPSLEELMQQDISLLKSESLLAKGLELCCKSYHILENLSNKAKVQKIYTEVVQDEELLICEELKKAYLKLQSEIKLEMIQTFTRSQTTGKPVQQQNNPLLLMKFNTKHAITLAKQQTLKQQVEEDEDSQMLQSLQDALDHDLGNDQYDTSDMKPSN